MVVDFIGCIYHVCPETLEHLRMVHSWFYGSHPSMAQDEIEPQQVFTLCPYPGPSCSLLVLKSSLAAVQPAVI